jgi:hypothetical protein
LGSPNYNKESFGQSLPTHNNQLINNKLINKQLINSHQCSNFLSNTIPQFNNLHLGWQSTSQKLKFINNHHFLIQLKLFLKKALSSPNCYKEGFG